MSRVPATQPLPYIGPGLNRAAVVRVAIGVEAVADEARHRVGAVSHLIAGEVSELDGTDVVQVAVVLGQVHQQVVSPAPTGR